jgi:hypothetical protein
VIRPTMRIGRYHPNRCGSRVCLGLSALMSGGDLDWSPLIWSPLGSRLDDFHVDFAEPGNREQRAIAALD